MTQTKKLTDIAQIEYIYRTRMQEDFASDELKPLSVIVQAWEKGIYDCYVLTRTARINSGICLLREEGQQLPH